MDLIVFVEPGNGTYPGHMAIGQDSSDGEPRFYGFYFDPDNLPAEFQAPERWQEYLYSNKTPGHISDDLKYVQGLRGDEARQFIEKRVVLR